MANRLVSVGDDSFLPPSIRVADVNLPAGFGAGGLAGKVDKGSLFINPVDYGAKFDGVTNDTAAIQACINVGGFIMFPAGTAIIDGDLAVGSYTHISGRGEGLTVLKIKNGAGWNARGVYFPQGSTRSSLSALTVDGNKPNRVLTGGSGGIYGTNVSVVNSNYIHVDHVASVNAVQHCFDVTSSSYGNAGDGATIPNPSEYVWLTDCFADQHGDDGFTTHGSGKIWFTRCVSYGTWWKNLTDYTNANGFEIDDYSYDVTMTDCYAKDNAHGFEVKAHGNMSAARNVRLIGCVAEANQVNFSLRHIGHTGATDALSLTAKNVQLIGCTSMFPKRVFFSGAEDFNQYAAMTVTAYRGVTISNFHAIGDPAAQYNGAAAIEFTGLCEDIILDSYHVEGHVTAGWDVYALGGGAPARNVTVTNGVHRDSSPNAVSVGSAGIGMVSNIRLTRNVSGSPNGTGIRVYGNNIVRSNTFATAYAPNYSISDTLYSVYETPIATNVPA